MLSRDFDPNFWIHFALRSVLSHVQNFLIRFKGRNFEEAQEEALGETFRIKAPHQSKTSEGADRDWFINSGGVCVVQPGNRENVTEFDCDWTGLPSICGLVIGLDWTAHEIARIGLD